MQIIIGIPEGAKGADGNGINNRSNNLQLLELKKKKKRSKGLTKCHAEGMKISTTRHIFAKFLASVDREKYIFSDS